MKNERAEDMGNIELDKVKCQYCPYLNDEKYIKGRKDGYHKAREETIRIIEGSSLDYDQVEMLKKLIKERSIG